MTKKSNEGYVAIVLLSVLSFGFAPIGSQFASPELELSTATNVKTTDDCSSAKHCLALKYVVYTDKNKKPVVSQAGVTQNLNGINSLWKKCGVQFQIAQYLPVSPSDYGLQFHTSNDSELDDIRRAFMDNSSLLVVTTGKWNRNGTLGNTGANAWTAMPGDATYGAVLESAVGTYAPIIAHELGHYLSLEHVSNVHSLMDPIIYDNSKNLSAAECQGAEQAVGDYWRAMVR